MARYYSNSDQAQRFQPGTTVRSDEVDGKFDAVASGFSNVETDVDRSLKLVADGSSHEVSATATQRRNKVVGFDGAGAMTLLAGFTWRGDFASGTEYFVNDVFRDPTTKNLRVVKTRHTAGGSIDTAKTDLAINVADVEAAKDAAKASEDEAEAWASRTSGQVDASDYSAKAYAIGGAGVDGAIGSAKDWAIKTDGTVDGTHFSAKYWATDTNVTTVAGNIADVNTVATDIADVSTVASEIGAGQDVTILAADLSGADTIGTVATNIADVNIVATDIANVNTVAADSAEIATVAGINADVSAVATIGAAVTGVNNIAPEVQAVEANAANITTVAEINGDVQTVAGIENEIGNVSINASVVDTVGSDLAGGSFSYDLGSITNPAEAQTNVPDGYIVSVYNIRGDVQTVAGIGAAVTDVASVEADVQTVAGIDSDVTMVASRATEVSTVAGYVGAGQDITVVAADIADVNTVAGISADVTTVSGISADVATVAGISTDVTTLNANEANVTTVADNITDVQSVAAVDTAVSSVSSNLTPIQTISSDLAGAAFGPDLGSITESATAPDGVPNGYLTTVYNIRSDVQGVASISTDVTGVAAIAGDVSTVAGVSADVTAVAGNAGNINTVATDISNVNTVAGSVSDVQSVSANIADVGVVADNLADVTNFANVYIGASSNAPSTRRDGSALEAGDLYFDTSADKLYVYSGSAWQPAPAAAADVSYDNTTSGLTGTDVQAAIDDEVAAREAHEADTTNPHNVTAAQASYSNAASGLTAADVQAAIDELESLKAQLTGGNTFSGNQQITGNLTVEGTLDCGTLA